MQIMEVTPLQAWQALLAQPMARLVDVRTEPEWLYVGEPDLARAAQPLLKLSWRLFPAMAISENFLDHLRAQVSREDSLFFLCRSGGRSLEAARAAASIGFAYAYSVAGGFEGPANDQGHRGAREGWKFAGLPWRQP
ncbi:MAG: sulfurtransferase [Rhizobiales bacterium 62-17]|nr:rhodanese-like domain-containing protein [Hyphomicrobiales bacterium]OJY00370.1 MAG: sulfurtransferase [Rhizobiales bacterium 62-17]